MWKVGSEQQSIKMDQLDQLDPVDPVDPVRVPKYGFTSTKPYFSFWESSGGLWGRSRHILLFLRRKKIPCGSAKDENRSFWGEKTPLRER